MTWFNMLEKLKKDKEIHGYCSVPSRCSSYKCLATWICNQRQQYWEMKEGTSSMMTAEHVDILNSLGLHGG
eukprot:9685477-Ditylum_brightwellii.AAC.1